MQSLGRFLVSVGIAAAPDSLDTYLQGFLEPHTQAAKQIRIRSAAIELQNLEQDKTKHIAGVTYVKTMLVTIAPSAYEAALSEAQTNLKDTTRAITQLTKEVAALKAPSEIESSWAKAVRLSGFSGHLTNIRELVRDRQTYEEVNDAYLKTTRANTLPAYLTRYYGNEQLISLKPDEDALVRRAQKSATEDQRAQRKQSFHIRLAKNLLKKEFLDEGSAIKAMEALSPEAVRQERLTVTGQDITYARESGINAARLEKERLFGQAREAWQKSTALSITDSSFNTPAVILDLSLLASASTYAFVVSAIKARSELEQQLKVTQGIVNTLESKAHKDHLDSIALNNAKANLPRLQAQLAEYSTDKSQILREVYRVGDDVAPSVVADSTAAHAAPPGLTTAPIFQRLQAGVSLNPATAAAAAVDRTELPAFAATRPVDRTVLPAVGATSPEGIVLRRTEHRIDTSTPTHVAAPADRAGKIAALESRLAAGTHVAMQSAHKARLGIETARSTTGVYGESQHVGGTPAHTQHTQGSTPEAPPAPERPPSQGSTPEAPPAPERPPSQGSTPEAPPAPERPPSPKLVLQKIRQPQTFQVPTTEELEALACGLEGLYSLGKFEQERIKALWELGSQPVRGDISRAPLFEYIMSVLTRETSDDERGISDIFNSRYGDAVELLKALHGFAREVCDLGSEDTIQVLNGTELVTVVAVALSKITEESMWRYLSLIGTDKLHGLSHSCINVQEILRQRNMFDDIIEGTLDSTPDQADSSVAGLPAQTSDPSRARAEAWKTTSTSVVDFSAGGYGYGVEPSSRDEEAEQRAIRAGVGSAASGPEPAKITLYSGVHDVFTGALERQASSSSGGGGGGGEGSRGPIESTAWGMSSSSSSRGGGGGGGEGSRGSIESRPWGMSSSSSSRGGGGGGGEGSRGSIESRPWGMSSSSSSGNGGSQWVAPRGSEDKARAQYTGAGSAASGPEYPQAITRDSSSGVHETFAAALDRQSSSRGEPISSSSSSGGRGVVDRGHTHEQHDESMGWIQGLDPFSTQRRDQDSIGRATHLIDVSRALAASATDPEEECCLDLSGTGNAATQATTAPQPALSAQHAASAATAAAPQPATTPQPTAAARGWYARFTVAATALVNVVAGAPSRAEPESAETQLSGLPYANLPSIAGATYTAQFAMRLLNARVGSIVPVVQGVLRLPFGSEQVSPGSQSETDGKIISVGIGAVPISSGESHAVGLVWKQRGDTIRLDILRPLQDGSNDCAPTVIEALASELGMGLGSSANKISIVRAHPVVLALSDGSFSVPRPLTLEVRPIEGRIRYIGEVVSSASLQLTHYAQPEFGIVPSVPCGLFVRLTYFDPLLTLQVAVSHPDTNMRPSRYSHQGPVFGVSGVNNAHVKYVRLDFNVLKALKATTVSASMVNAAVSLVRTTYFPTTENLAHALRQIVMVCTHVGATFYPALSVVSIGAPTIEAYFTSGVFAALNTAALSVGTLAVTSTVAYFGYVGLGIAVASTIACQAVWSANSNLQTLVAEITSPSAALNSAKAWGDLTSGVHKGLCPITGWCDKQQAEAPTIGSELQKNTASAVTIETHSTTFVDIYDIGCTSSTLCVVGTSAQTNSSDLQW